MSWEVILGLLVKNVVIPELMEFITDFQAKNGRLPTKEELEAQADLKAQVIIDRGTAFLNRPPEVPPV